MRTIPQAYVTPAPTDTARPRSSDGVGINVQIYGPDDAPTVVLIHGWTCQIRFWAPVINELHKDLRIVAYDQRGHGASDTPGRGHYSTQALVDDLTAVLDATVPAGEGRKAVLAGHSMGGMTIMGAALRPSILSRTSAVLLASTGYGDLIDLARIAPGDDNRARRARATFHRSMLSSTAPIGPMTPITRAALKYGTLGKASSKELATVNAGILLECGRRPRAAWGKVLQSLDVGDGASALNVPVSVLVGTQDRLTPRKHAYRIAERVPNLVGVTELPGIGHMTPLEAPDTVARLIRDLVALGRPDAHSHTDAGANFPSQGIALSHAATALSTTDPSTTPAVPSPHSPQELEHAEQEPA